MTQNKKLEKFAVSRLNCLSLLYSIFPELNFIFFKFFFGPTPHNTGADATDGGRVSGVDDGRVCEVDGCTVFVFKIPNF